MDFLPETKQKLVDHYAFLPFIIQLFQHDRTLIASSSIQIKKPYLDLLDKVILLTELDFKRTKQKLKQHGISISKEKRSMTGIELYYRYGGYHYQREFKWEFVHKRIIMLMHEYLANEAVERLP